MLAKIFRQCYAIIIKNLSNHWTNKKKFFGQFIFPVVISVLYILMKKYTKSNPIIGMIVGVLLKMYIAMIGLSSIRQLVTLFLNQRQQKHRQYQIIFGLSTRCHTLSNLLYMGLYTSLFLFPFYLILNYYQGFHFYYIGIFAAFVISSLTLSMMMTSFFTDHKIASQIIGMVFSLSSFLPLLYSGGQNKNEAGEIVYTTVDYIGMFMPNSSFAIAILYNNQRASLLSVSIVKIYLLIYSIMQFPHQYKQLFISCKNWFLQKCYGRNQLGEHRNLLTQQFNVSDQIPENSESQSNGSSSGVNQRNIMIRIHNLVKTYKIKQGQFNALNRINLTIKKKQIFGLLGRNGAGKTTLVDILTDVCGQTSGQFFINYQKGEGQEDQDKQKIGICYQHQIQYQQLTVEQHLYFYSRIKNIKTPIKQTIQNIVQMLGIKQQYRKKVKQLSGGNKRKLSVAIALLGNPQLMIFDQPTSGLDPLSRRSVWQILQKLRQNFNTTIILTTHHLDEAQVLSDLICVIQKGSILVQNTPDVIKSKYGNGYYLTIQFQSPLHLHETLPAISTYLESVISKVEDIQTQANISKLFLKFPPYQQNSNKSSSQFNQQQLLLLQILSWLDKLENIKIQVEKNSLEQSFIAILKDPENLNSTNSSGQSLELRNISNRPLNHRKTIEDAYNQSILDKVLLIMKQTLGIFIRCIYFHKGQSLKFFITYNINILIFLFAMMFNKFVLKAIETGSQKMDQMSSGAFQKISTENQKYSNNMLVLQGYIIMAGSFMAIPIYQKQKNIRRVLNSRGVSSLAYWLGNFIFDFGYFLINLLILSKFISPQSFEFVYNEDGKGMLQFILLGVGMIIYTYTVSNLFEKITTANTWFSIFNMLAGFIILPMIIVGHDSVFGYFAFIKYFYPYYDLNLTIMKQTMKTAGGKLIENYVIQNDENQYIYFAISFYFIMLILVETRAWQRFKQTCWRRERLQRNQNNIQLRAVYKQYESVQALKNVNYFVGNQRLALIGHNGAGKSTTFGLLSGQINPTSGKLFLQNQTKLNHQKIMRSAGICYQQNCLWQSMTPLEIFSIISHVVPIQHSGKQIEWILESLQFESMNFNKRFENLSGGNKRKICMAVALFGDPLIRLLDECSTGLDPSSRVAMVETIKNSRSGSTIFTTHSMTEAQDLCSKTVIMKKGQVLEFDYIYKLKQKYYNCYWIDVVFTQNQQSIQSNTYQSQHSSSIQSQSTSINGNNQALLLAEEQSYISKNITLIQNQLRYILNQTIRQNHLSSEIDINKNMPKILKATKQSKMRIQWEKQVWPLHLSLKSVYLLRNRLQKHYEQNSLKQDKQENQNKFNLVSSIYITQPKLQDIYIRLTHDSSDANELTYHYKEYANQQKDKQNQEGSKLEQERQVQFKSSKQLISSSTEQNRQKEIELIEM